MATSSSDLWDELSRGLGADLVGDPYPVFAERRRSNPVMDGDIMAEFGLPSFAQALDGSRQVFTLFRYDDIAMALRESQIFSSSVILEAFTPIMGRVILGMDGEEHRSWRGIIKPAFAKRLIDMWHTQLVQPVTQQLAEEVAASPDRRANLVELAVRFPVEIIFEILGLPRGGAGYGEFGEAGLTMALAVNGMNSTDPEATMRAVMKAQQSAGAMYDAILPIVEARRAAGSEGEDLIGHLLRAEFEGERLDDDQIAVFVRSLLPAAADTTTRSWLNAMVCILSRPDVVDEIRADRSLVIDALNEGLRLESSTTVLGRITTQDIEIRGKTIPAGSGVTVATASANRDEEVYEDPDTYDLHRRMSKPSMNFGLGAHFCPGMQAAKAEMLEATNAILDLLPGLRLDPDAEPPVIRGMAARSPAALHVVWDA